jgi:hypothetical protein
VVLLQSGVQELKKITSRCAEAAPQLAASFISGPSPRCCLLARLRNLHGWNRRLLSGVVQTRFAPDETFGP